MFEKTILNNPYIKEKPSPKQTAFLMLNCREALYGGAAGGGKSSALLMAALQYVHLHGYTAIVFRRSITDLELPSALIHRSREWLTDTPARWNGSEFKWRFPSGAILQFGYLKKPDDKYRYKSAEFNFIGFDELTEFPCDDYLYLSFSRLRRRVGIAAPLRVRGATNPGGIGHEWVKERFIPLDYVESSDPARFNKTWRKKDCIFVPAKAEDNRLGLNVEEYRQTLMGMNVRDRKQLLDGDWRNYEGGKFNRAWALRYQVQQDYYALPESNSPGATISRVPASSCTRFIVIDPAGTSREVAEAKAGKHSHTVISTWDMTPRHGLLLLDVERAQLSVPESMDRIKAKILQFRPQFTLIENAHVGRAILQILHHEGVTVKGLEPESKDKMVRANTAIVRMEGGMIWFPSKAPWLESWEEEIFAWSGSAKEQDDQVDCLAYAAIYADQQSLRENLGTGLFVMEANQAKRVYQGR